MLLKKLFSHVAENREELDRLWLLITLITFRQYLLPTFAWGRTSKFTQSIYTIN